MPWVRLDQDAMDHPKVAQLSDGAFRLWIAGLAYCQRHLTDGLIPSVVLPSLQRYSTRRVRELVDQGLWHQATAGLTVHDYLEWNDSKAAVARKKALKQERQSRHRGKSDASRDASHDAPQDASLDAPPGKGVCRGGGVRREEKNVGAPIVGGPHRSHACCGRVCLPAVLFSELCRKHGGDPDDADRYVRAWFAKWDDLYTTGARRDEVIGDDDFAVWRARWASDHPSSCTPRARKTAANLAVAERFLKRHEGDA